MFAEVFERMFSEDVEAQVLDVDRHPKALNEFMQIAIDTALEGMSDGGSKEREPFAAVVVKDGKVISVSVIPYEVDYVHCHGTSYICGLS